MLAKKLARVASEVGHDVRPDARNESHKYAYVSAAAVKRAVSPVLARHGIATTLETEIISRDEFTTATGTVFDRVVVRARLTFIDGATGAMLTTEGLGAGSDAGEKAVMKALTSAEKYAYVGALGLALGDDPERTDHERADLHRSPPQTVRASSRRRERPTQEPAAQSRHGVTGLPEVASRELGACSSLDGLAKWAARWSASGADHPSIFALVRQRARALEIPESRVSELEASLRAASPQRPPASSLPHQPQERRQGEAARRDASPQAKTEKE